MPRTTQVNFRAGETTIARIRLLMRRWDCSQSQAIAVAIAAAAEEITMKPQPGPTAEFTAAEARVNATPELDAYRDIILDTDWIEPDHLTWVATAPVAEIVRWAESIAADAE